MTHRKDCCHESVRSDTCVTLNGIDSHSTNVWSCYRLRNTHTCDWAFGAVTAQCEKQAPSPLRRRGKQGSRNLLCSRRSTALSLKLQEICCSDPEGSQSDHTPFRATKAWAKLEWVPWLEGYAVFSQYCLWRFMAHQSLKVESWLPICFRNCGLPQYPRKKLEKTCEHLNLSLRCHQDSVYKHICPSWLFKWPNVEIDQMPINRSMK